MTDHAPADDVRTLLDPSTVSPEEHDAAHASQVRVKLQHEGRTQFGTAIVTDDHRVVIELESGDLYTMQLASSAAAQLQLDLDTIMVVELDPPNTGEGVAVQVDTPAPFEFPPPESHPLEPEVADWHSQEARRFREPQMVVDSSALRGLVGSTATDERTAFAEVRGFPPGWTPSPTGVPLYMKDGLPVEASSVKPQIKAPDRSPAGLPLLHGKYALGDDGRTYETGDPEVDALVAEGLANLPTGPAWESKARVHGPMLAAVARMVIAHTPAERYREIAADPELQRRADNLRASMGAGFIGQAEVDNLRRAELVPLDVQIEAALRLVAEARAGEGDAACKQCGHPVVQRRLASIHQALAAMAMRTRHAMEDEVKIWRERWQAHERAISEITGAYFAAGLGRSPTSATAIADALRRISREKDELDLVMRQIVREMQRLRGHLGDADYLETALCRIEALALPYVEMGDVAARQDKPGFTAGDPRLDGAAHDTRFVDLFYLPGQRIGLRFAGFLCPLALPPDEAMRLAAAIATGGESLQKGDGVLLVHAVDRQTFEGVAAGLIPWRIDMREMCARHKAAEAAGQSHAVAHDGKIPRPMLMGPEPADNIRIKVRLDWQDPEADMWRMFAATEGARGALVSRQRVAEPEPTVELVLPFEAYGLLTDTPGLREKLEAEFPFVVAVLERGLPDTTNSDTLRFEARFNGGQGGASIYLGGRSAFLTGRPALELAEALDPGRTSRTFRPAAEDAVLDLRADADAADVAGLRELAVSIRRTADALESGLAGKLRTAALGGGSK